VKKNLPILVIIVTIMALIIYSSKKTVRRINWEESFNEKSNTPYGLSVFYKELPTLFKEKKILTVYHMPHSYLRANSKDTLKRHKAKGNFIIIGNSNYLYAEAVYELLDFVEKGNTLFISDYNYPETLSDTLNVNIDYVFNEKDSISELSLKHDHFNSFNIDKNDGDYYFENLEQTNYTTLGYSEIEEKRVNFIKIKRGEGNIYLHLQPKAFTNYNLLKENRYEYVEGLISYLPNENIYFDSYSKIYNSYNDDVEKESNLSWFLQQRAFRWAWYFALLLTLIFIIFNAKRKQRIIKIVKPLQNTTVAFVKTISNLYFETQDHKNLVYKKIIYFLEKVRKDYNIDTHELNDEFIKKLASKSGKKVEEIKKLINYINWLRSKNEFFEENLIKLNKYIEAFYSK